MLYSFAVKICFFIFKYLCKWKVEGVENFPKEGSAIIVANHVSYWDAVVLAVAVPRRVYFMGHSGLFKIPVFAQIIKNLGAFPVDRNKSDRAALRAAMEILNRGDVMGIFPEGTRIRDGRILGEFKMGAAMIASKTDAPLVPVALINTPNIFSRGFFRSFKVVIKEPVYITKEENQKVTSQQLQEVSNDIRVQILTILQDSKDF